MAAGPPRLGRDDHREWPFFEPRHREFAAQLDAWADAHVAAVPHDADVDATCRRFVTALGDAGWLRAVVPGTAHGGTADAIDTRLLCLAREILASRHALADFAFAMQGLGAGAISLDGSSDQKARWLPLVATGRAIPAFALSEAEAGSDVAALACRATDDGDAWRLDGEKTWISNAGIADVYVVFARSAEGARRSDGITAFLVEAGTPGFDVTERIQTMAPHPLGTLRFAGCRVPKTNVIGQAGAGFKLAMRTLDVFRTSVAAAAVGFARRALDEAVARATTRRLFGGRLGDLPLAQAALAEMATTVDAAALLTYRAAWRHDLGAVVTVEAAMAKRAATEGAQRVIDAAVQLFGGAGVRSGTPVEVLYRDIRALRIYEGASEVQQLIVGKALVKDLA
jgi:alkylation response protein AidB-like acyl-CoA dehydrogenase